MVVTYPQVDFVLDAGEAVAAAARAAGTKAGDTANGRGARPLSLTATLALHFRPGIHDPATADRLLSFVAHVAAAAAGPGGAKTRVADLPLQGPDDVHALTHGFNCADAAPPAADATLHGLFGASAAARPGSPCVLPADGAPALTYANVDTHSAALASRLAGLGARTGTLVGLALRRSPDAVVAILATLRVGAGYLPLDPGAPAERLAAVVQDAGPVVVLVDDAESALAAGLAATGVRVLSLAAAAAMPPAVLGPEHCATSADVAYVIFTSGSTGRPKGAVLKHASAVNYVTHAVADLGLGPADVCLLKTTFVFDVHVSELYLALAAGAALALASADGHKDVDHLAAVIDGRGVTLAHWVPSQLALYLRGLAPGSGASLRLLVASGEALPSATAAATVASLPHARLLDLYGPTEAAVHCTGCDAGEWLARGWPHAGMTIGRPLPGVRAYVVDAAGAPAPIGVPGELLVSGVQVADGYMGRPDLTAKAFVANPFADGPDHGRAYRTGDLARWVLPAAAREPVLEYLGRVDHQVKVRGYRIELGEVRGAER